MARFAVGEIVKIVKARYPENIGIIAKIEGVQEDGFLVEHWGEPCYFIDHPGRGWYSPESNLRKLPPDDDQPANRDTTEDPGLTRLKKLLKQDTMPHKQTKREKA